MNRYTLERVVGEGGMAEVHRAWVDGPGGFRRLVAVKRLLSSYASQPALRARFQDEARIAARLHHPCVVAVFDYYEEADRQHLVMEYVDGVSVEHLVKQGHGGRFLSPRLVTLLMFEATRAIAYAHAQGVLHRDVSCCNLLVSREGEVKLADFGLADASHRVSSTEPGALSGKLAYLSPERSQGLPATPQDDLFALGVVLARLLRAVDPRLRAAADCAPLLTLVTWLTAPRAQRAPSAQALAARLRVLPRADAEELARLVRDNPQPRGVAAPAPRLVGADLDDATDAGARGDLSRDTTTSAAPLPPRLKEMPAIALDPGPSFPALPSPPTVKVPAVAPTLKQLPAVAPVAPRRARPVLRRVLVALLLAGAGFLFGRLSLPSSTVVLPAHPYPHATSPAP